MDDLWWYLVRASGIVAVALGVAAMFCGLLFSARDTGRWRRPNWWLDLHNQLGGLALIFTAVHLVAVYADEFNGLGLVQILVPFTAPDQTWGMALGVVSAWLFALVVFTSWPKRLFSRRVWRVVHLSSLVGLVLGGVHGYLTGYDAPTLAFRALLVAGLGIVVYATTIRLVSVLHRRVAKISRNSRDRLPVGSRSTAKV
ncbi:MAG: ferric reductase-like transmembrane domain-containing protein [Acidimicrobiales bacterium]|nr:ferric reductase-like transmembrane domain-containing protein [Acidimicrobiales bacterium]